MSFYADWDHTSYPGQTLRRDTRIYWTFGPHNPARGRCIGTFIGENLGAGRAVNGLDGWQLLVGKNGQPGDQTLLSIKAAWATAVYATSKTPRPDDYIEVLNLYYFRCGSSGVALAAWTAAGGSSIYFPLLRNGTGFVIVGWGKSLNKSPEAGF
jgi:hypothetical protein